MAVIRHQVKVAYWCITNYRQPFVKLVEYVLILKAFFTLNMTFSQYYNIVY